MRRTPAEKAHLLALAAMPSGSPMEAWEDGYKAGWEDAMDTAIDIIRQSMGEKP